MTSGRRTTKTRYVNCSFTKIILVFFLSLTSFFLLKIFASVHVYGQRVDRKLQSIQNSQNDDRYVEVLRDKPLISLSSKVALDKIQEQKRMKKKYFPGLPATGAHQIGGNAGLSHLKLSLKDPSFVKKLKDMENKRQDLYVSILDKRGQLVRGEDGSMTIVSYPQVPVRFPNNLKREAADYSAKESMWLNITHFPWPLDQSCRKYSVSFGRNLSVVGLASYPSSGNTWLRYLLEGISGFYSGSMYNDLTLRQKGFYGEGVAADSGMVMTVKTHGHTTDTGSHMPRDMQNKYNHHSEVNKTAILLIRNPFAAIMGHRNLDQGGHTGLAKPEDFSGEGWDSFVKIKTESWLNFYSDWLETSQPENILVIHYENIKINLRHSLRRILDFLSLEEDEGRLRCTVEHNTGLFKRDHQKATIDDPYTEEQKHLVKDNINKLNARLKQRGKETLPTHLYNYF